jgi:hypothetical protein
VTFHLPDGASYEGENPDGTMSFRISMPLDDHGYFGRECPECEQLFRIAGDDYEALPDDVHLWCVYCGHSDDHTEFVTSQQMERALRVAGDVGVQMAGDALDAAFGSLASQHRRGPLRITYRSEPFFPDPLPGITEEEMIRERCCASCGLHYAVFGEHRFCPVCGPLTASVAAQDALAAEAARLAVLDLIPQEARGALREQGVYDRAYVDVVKNVVGVVEALAKAEFTRRVANASEALKGKGSNVFQRLEDAADLFRDYLGVDLRAGMGDNDWQALLALWAGRHLYTHCDGVIDQKYLSVATGTRQRVGQRLRITETDARRAIDLVTRLVELIATR